jgi:rhodanese-related sulfurtransferase
VRSARLHLGLAITALTLGALAAASGTATPDATAPSSVSALELARWIRHDKTGLRVIDVRDTGAFESFAITGAEHVSLQTVGRKEWPAEQTVVVYGEDEDAAAKAAGVLRSVGVRNALVLRGGVAEWARTIAAPVLPPNPSPDQAAASRELAELSRWFGGVPRVGEASTSGADSLRASLARIQRRGC